MVYIYIYIYIYGIYIYVYTIFKANEITPEKVVRQISCLRVCTLQVKLK